MQGPNARHIDLGDLTKETSKSVFLPKVLRSVNRDQAIPVWLAAKFKTHRSQLGKVGRNPAYCVEMKISRHRRIGMILSEKVALAPHGWCKVKRGKSVDARAIALFDLSPIAASEAGLGMRDGYTDNPTGYRTGERWIGIAND